MTLPGHLPRGFGSRAEEDEAPRDLFVGRPVGTDMCPGYQ